MEGLLGGQVAVVVIGRVQGNRPAHRLQVVTLDHPKHNCR